MKWQFSVPETFALKTGEGIREKSVVADDEGFQSEQNLWERGQYQQRQQQRKPPRREPVASRLFPGLACGLLHPPRLNQRQREMQCRRAE